MKRLMAGIMLSMMLGGCALQNNYLFTGFSQRSKLTDAVSALENGNEPAAKRMLADICSGPKVDGVTDEAMFRLTLLELRQYDEPEGMEQIQGRLKRLRAEYPSSPWTKQIWPLMEYISSAEGARNDLRTTKVRNSGLAKENRELRLSNQQLQSSNQTLTRENRELNQRIDKLKELDIKLELKNKR